MKTIILLALWLAAAACLNLDTVTMGLEESLARSDVPSAVKALVHDFDYSEDSINRAYDRCVDEDTDDDKLLPCFIAGLFRERVLEKHKTILCASEYFNETAVDCIMTCFHNYTPECLKCVGKHLPRLLECMADAPYEYM